MIDPSSEYGAMFTSLLAELHNRRTGRVGNRRWDPSKVKPTRIRPPLQLLEDYRAGDPPLRSDIHSGWGPQIRRFIRMGRLNMADLITASTADRMKLVGFRTAAAGDELGDQQAHAMMTANDGEILSSEVHEAFLALGDAYVFVGDLIDGWPLITHESPFETITREDPATRRTIVGMKVYRDAWDTADIAEFYIGNTGHKLIRQGPSDLTADRKFRFTPGDWEVEENVFTTPGVPIVRFRNRDGVGEYERHLDSLDRINDKIFDEWWIAKIQAFRQRAVKNLPDTRTEYDENGNPREVPVAEDEYDGMFTSSPDEMWQVPGDVEFWESSPVDMTPITAAVEKDIKRLAATVRVSLPTFSPDVAGGSAEGATLMREEHVYKVENRISRAKASWAKVASLGFQWMGDTERADRAQLEAVFGPTERHSLSQKANAAAQAKDSLPREAIQRDIWQYPPSEIPQLQVMEGRDLLASPLFATTPDPGTGGNTTE